MDLASDLKGGMGILPRTHNVEMPDGRDWRQALVRATAGGSTQDQATTHVSQLGKLELP